MNETQKIEKESSLTQEFFRQNNIAREFKLPCALVLRATPVDYDKLIASIAKNFPSIILVKGRMDTDRLWILTDNELNDARHSK